MTPKEKAEELVNKFSTVGLQQRNEGISCALIAINEMMQANCDLMENAENVRQYYYFQEVKQEIENL